MQELVSVALQLHALYQPAVLQPAALDLRATHHPWALLLGSLVLAGTWGLLGHDAACAVLRARCCMLAYITLN